MGRRQIYHSDEERKEAQRQHALKYYYRRKALKEQTEKYESKSDDVQDRINVTVCANSKKLGSINEDIQYKTTPSGHLMKIRNKTQN